MKEDKEGGIKACKKRQRMIEDGNDGVRKAAKERRNERNNESVKET